MNVAPNKQLEYLGNQLVTLTGKIKEKKDNISGENYIKEISSLQDEIRIVKEIYNSVFKTIK